MTKSETDKGRTDLQQIQSAAESEVTSAQIGASDFLSNAVSAGSLVSAQIRASDFLSKSISAGSLVNAQIRASDFLGSAVSAGSLVSAQIRASDFLSKSISAGSLVNARIRASDFLGSAVSAGSLVSAQIRASDFLSKSISAGSLVNARIRASDFLGSAVSAGSLVSAQIRASDFLSSAVSAGSLVSAQIRTSDILGKPIAASALTANQISTSSFIKASGVLTKTVSAYSAISPSLIHSSDLRALTPDRFAIANSKEISSAGLYLNSAVDQFGVASILLRVASPNKFDRGMLSNLLESTFADIDTDYQSAFNVTQTEAAPTAFISIEGADEPEFDRNRRAYAALLAFEIKLRRFIADKMAAKYGTSWIKQRVPGDLHAAWKEKKAVDEGRGRLGKPLIDYADFTDYVKIIERNDNWRELFESTFKRKESIRESLLRLYPIRIDTMHARILTQDDELWLQAEMRRIVIAMQ